MPPDAPFDSQPRLDFLHGVRGLAALTVVLFHLALNTGPDSAGPIIRTLCAPLLHGYLAVPVFLVLSGFLLAMPVVTNGLVLRGGIRGFMSRRALRILPPYYAAYLLDMLFFAAASKFAAIVGSDPGQAVQQQIERGYRWPSVAAHLLLVHNMDLEWNRGMDAILWTIACEWQICILFAIALVPIWRRAGVWAMLSACVLLAAAITEACVRGWGTYLVPWMLPIFGLGAAGASVSFGTTHRAAAIRQWPWATITVASVAMLIAAIGVLDMRLPQETLMPYYATSLRVRWIYDVLAGAAAASLIVWLTRTHEPVDRHWSAAALLRRLLESRWLHVLGRFSYSLYLTHGIVLVFMARVTTSLWPYRTVHWAVMMIGGTLLSLAVAYVFHLCVERRFVAGGIRRRFRRGADD